MTIVAAYNSVFNGFSAVCVYKYQCAVSSEDDEDKGEETFGGNGHFGRDPR